MSFSYAHWRIYFNMLSCPIHNNARAFYYEPRNISTATMSKPGIKATSESHLLVNNVRILLILLRRDPHLAEMRTPLRRMRTRLTFLKVLRPARMDPPIQVEYFLSGGA
jgi:hypothetical protein